MISGTMSRVFSTTLNNLKRLFKPDQSLKPEAEQVYLASRVTNPWQEELDRLVADRAQGKSRFTEPVNEQLSNLTDIAKEERQALEEAAKANAKLKRTGDGTVSDLRVWWGESVVTWDPDLINTLDSSEQRPLRRAIRRWFH